MTDPEVPLIGRVRPSRDSTSILKCATAIERQRLLVDRALSSPSPWRGTTRREVFGHSGRGEAERYALAYSVLTRRALASDWEPSVDELLFVSRLITGITRFRESGIRVGRFRTFPRSFDIPLLLSHCLDSYRLSGENRVTAAIRLHLRILSIHPFIDGNGRTSRMIATMCLVRGGHRSTLVTALEEILATRKYLTALAAHWSSMIDEDECVLRLLRLVRNRSAGVAAIRAREAKLIAICSGLGIPPASRLDAIQDAERGNCFDLRSQRLGDSMSQQGVPFWHEVLGEMSVENRLELSDELLRIATEENDVRG